MVTMDLLWVIAFLEQCQAANKAASVLEKIAKDKKKSKDKKIACLPVACSRDLTNSIIARSATIIKATNAIATTDNPTIIINTINAMIILAATTRITRATSPMIRRMIASAIT